MKIKELSGSEKVLAYLVGLIVILFIVAPLALVLDGYVVMKLWNWFILPVFGNAEQSLVGPLTLLEGMGLSLFIGFVALQYVEKQNELKAFLHGTLLKPPIYLAIGAIIRWYSN